MKSSIIMGLLFFLVSGFVLPMDINQPDISLEVTTPKQQYKTVVDLNVPIGEMRSAYVQIQCKGAFNYYTSVTISHDNPHFSSETRPIQILCGSLNFPSVRFTPSSPGIEVDHMTFTGEWGKVMVEILGNGVATEPAESWIADLGEGTSIQRLVYDNQRNLIYLTDSGNNQVIIFSPAQKAVVNRISVGLHPVGLAITPDNQKLYVANAGEHYISVISLANQVQLEKIAIPTLYPNPSQDYHFQYMPYEITVVSSTLALLGSVPPGLASGAPIFDLDLTIKQVAPRTDYTTYGLGVTPVFRTSRDYSSTSIVLEPESSPTVLLSYDTYSNSLAETQWRLERTTAINNNGTRFVTTNNDCNTMEPNLALFNKQAERLVNIELSGCQSVSAAFNPVNPNYIYALDGREEKKLEVARIDTSLQTKVLTFNMPAGYYQASHTMVVSNDGQWVYAPILQTWGDPPSKIIAIKVGPTEYSDSTPPITTMTPLAAIQSHTWWGVRWSGMDASSGIDHYQIEYRVGQDGEWVTWMETTATIGTFFNGKPGEVYYFRVIAYDRAGNIEAYPYNYETFTTSGSDSSGIYTVHIPVVAKQ